MNAKIDRMIRDLREAAERSELKALVLFGSFARGEASGESDVDLFVVCERGEEEERFSEELFGIEKKYDIRIEALFYDESLKADSYLLEQVLREGVLIYGKMPRIDFERLQLRPYELIKYDLSGLSQREKMKLKAALYGWRIARKYKSTQYVNEKRGLVDALKGWRTGIASVMVPTNSSKKIVNLLEEQGALWKSFPVWMAGQ